MPVSGGDGPVLITGVTGQDGHYLAEQVIAAGQQVFGLVNDDAPLPPGVRAVPGDLCDAASLAAALQVSGARTVYNLAALSSVAASWADPVAVAEVGGVGVARLLAAVRARQEVTGQVIRVVQASSAEIFGDAPAPQRETTPIAPTNPYGAAKAYAQHICTAFRAEGLWVATAILFPHESPRRPAGFVSRKITSTVAAIATGRAQSLTLGNLEARRDWGFAADYTRALHLIAASDTPTDYVVATGTSHSIGEFAAAAFTHAGITDWPERLHTSQHHTRPTDATDLRGDPTRARHHLGWTPQVDFDQLVAMMVDHDLHELHAPRD